MFSFLAYAEESVPDQLKNVTYKDIDKYEIELRKFYKDLPPEKIQQKYLLASRHFSQIGEYGKALYILEKGISISKPDTGYLRDLISLLDQQKKKEEIQKYFTKYITNKSFNNTDIDELSEIILIYMRNDKILSTDIDEFLQDALKKSAVQEQVKWLDSITHARSKRFKDALAQLKGLNLQGEEENCYFSYLQKKNGVLPKYCSKVLAYPDLKKRTSYLKTCTVLVNEKSDIEQKIKSTDEIMEFTPLYEVLY